jgi:hypothetical protein
MIEDAAEFLGLYLYGEINMHTGKHDYKVGTIVNEKGGVRNLLTTSSETKFRKFILQYEKRIKSDKS